MWGRGAKRGAVTVFEYGNDSKQFRSVAISRVEFGGGRPPPRLYRYPSGAQPDALLSAQKKNCKQTLIGFDEEKPN